MKYISLKSYFIRLFLLFVSASILLSAFFIISFNNKINFLFDKNYDNFQESLLFSISDDIENELNTLMNSISYIASEINELYSFNNPHLVKYLKDKHKEYQVFTNGLYVFDNKGVLVAETIGEVVRKGKDFSFREYYRQMLEKQRPFVSDLYYSSLDHGNPCIMVLAPIVNRYGVMIGFVGGSINLLQNNGLAYRLNSFSQEDFYFSLYSSTGYTIVHKNKDFIGKRFNISDLLINKSFQDVDNSNMLRRTNVISGTDWYVSLNFSLDNRAFITEQTLHLIILNTGFLILLFSILLLILAYRINKYYNDYLSRIEKFTNLVDMNKKMPLVKIKELDFISKAMNKLKEEYVYINEKNINVQGSNKSLLQNSIFPIFILNSIEGKIVDISDVALEFLGYERFDIIEHNISDVLFKDSISTKQLFVEFIGKCDSSIKTFESFIYAANNTRVFVRITAKIDNYEGHDSIFLTFLNMKDEITYQKRIKHLTNKINKLIEFVEVPICITDMSGNIRYYNPYFYDKIIKIIDKEIYTIFDLFSCTPEAPHLINLFTNISKQYIINRSVQINFNKSVDGRDESLSYYLYWQYEVGNDNNVDKIMFIFTINDTHNSKKGIL